MPLNPDITLQDHQRRVRANAEEAARQGQPLRMLLNWGTGSGKSIGALGIADALNAPATIIGPAALRQTLRGESERLLGHSNYPVYSYNAAARGKVAPSQTLIIDEAQRLGSPASAQAKAVQNLANQARNVILMSATPVRNRPSEFAPLLSILQNKPISHDEFSQRYVGTEAVGPGLIGRLLGRQTVTRPAVVNTSELLEKLRGKVDTYEPEAPPVPVKEETVEAEMPKRQAELYRGLYGKLPWLIRQKLKYRYPLTDSEIAKARSFLTGPRQAALSDLPYQARRNPIKAFEGSGKLVKAHGALKEKLSDPRAKAIVYSNFLESGLRPYSAALTRDQIPHAIFHGGLSDVERKDLVDKFNKGDLRAALIAPAGSEGISLKGSQLVQLLDKYWNQARSTQAKARGIRFDSHTNLPEDLQNVNVQHYNARLPYGIKDRLLSRLGYDRTRERETTDDYLDRLSTKKDQLNEQLMAVLRQAGQVKQSMDDYYANGDHHWSCEKCGEGFDTAEDPTCPKCGGDCGHTNKKLYRSVLLRREKAAADPAGAAKPLTDLPLVGGMGFGQFPGKPHAIMHPDAGTGTGLLARPPGTPLQTFGTPRFYDAVSVSNSKPAPANAAVATTPKPKLPTAVPAVAAKAGRDEKCPDGECCPHCEARLERDPYSGTCNRCGKDWPHKKADESTPSDAKPLVEAGGLWRYRCPHCQGVNAFNGDPNTGSRFRGGARCVDCGGGFAAVRASHLLLDAGKGHVCRQCGKESGESGGACPYCKSDRVDQVAKVAGKCCSTCGDGCPADAMPAKKFKGTYCPRCGVFCETCKRRAKKLRNGKCTECSGDLVPDTEANREKYATAADITAIAELTAYADVIIEYQGQKVAVASRDAQTVRQLAELAEEKQSREGRLPLFPKNQQPLGSAIQYRPGQQPGGILDELLDAKAMSDRFDYRGKTEKLRTLIARAPHDWNVDSHEEYVVGLQHTPTGFRFHLPRHMVVDLLPQADPNWSSSQAEAATAAGV